MPEVTHPRKLTILAICCLALLMVGMDTSIVNVALTSIRTDLHASVSGLQWTVDAYTMVLATLLLLAGSTGDRLGRRRVFLAGLVVFTSGSLLCSVAPGLGWLIVFRMVQAVGGSMLNPVAMGIITNVFTETKERAFAIGVWGATVGVSIGLGPVVGGLLIESVGWRGIFWINIPIGLAAIVLVTLFVPESKAERARRPDPLGQVLVILLLASLTWAIIEAPRLGWSSVRTLLVLAVTVAALVALLGWEKRREEPLIELRFFRSVPFSSATVMAVCAFGNYAGFLFLNTLYLQQVRDYSALEAGVATLPLAVGSLFFAPLSGRIVGTRGPRIPLVGAGVLMTLGAVMLLHADRGTPLTYVLASYLLFSIGFGLVNTPITNSAVAGMPRSRAGLASAFATTSRQIGATLGVAVVGSVLNSSLGGRTVHEGFASAETACWWVVAGCGAAIVVIGLMATSGWAKQTAERVLTEDLPPMGHIQPAKP
ncbi:MFS transporter [Streptomyces fulvoviolaceus]|uniref:MFS transporter n=1 Tax=Streptomyces fulvoviolaceus TaxID=285535 RepID=UPI0004CC3F16|nr:MFS transporter [Streptomyces fulvoviolaceus]MCT9083687.1 MFS transporter [Streptomyces fulvoviolaceus]